VRVLVRNADAVLAGRDGVELALGDVADAACVRRVCQGARGIFHLVGIVEHSRAAAANVYKINVNGTVNVMEAAAEHHLKVVFVSTSGVVGVSRDGARVATDIDGFATAVIKDWPYYDSKRQAEIAATDIARQRGVALVIIRPSSILGGSIVYGRNISPQKACIHYTCHYSLVVHSRRECCLSECSISPQKPFVHYTCHDSPVVHSRWEYCMRAIYRHRGRSYTTPVVIRPLSILGGNAFLNACV